MESVADGLVWVAPEDWVATRVMQSGFLQVTKQDLALTAGEQPLLHPQEQNSYRLTIRLPEVVLTCL